MVPGWVSISSAVQEALESGEPVCALETTILTHGLPRPENYDVAVAAEEEVRAAGAVPATIGVLDGTVKVGMGRSEIRRLAEMPDAAKIGRRELAVAAALGLSGGCTVSGTCTVASAVGIGVMATGGIGGVHRGVEATGDISADLLALAVCSMVVVCSGPKSILDVPKTLELLETLSVPIVGYGTDTVPLFYVRSSPYKVTCCTESPAQIGRIARAARDLGLAGAVLVVNPVPEDAAMDSSRLEESLRRGESSAQREGISGQRVTPYLLDWIHRETHGASLRANVALMKSNARLAGLIARHLAKV
ncbi:MAG: pseudouridine-5'-phosphate glycosidase [Firmicutes bacterium]|nr:pseudouridine-5'-phosphate glycosidase [Bacillota bacterium]